MSKSPENVPQTFNFDNMPIRAFNKGGEVWFSAADVCEALGIANPRDAIGRLDEDEKGVASADTPGGPQNIGTINESGLYSLILTSRKEEAKRFKRWITHDVLPSIRKTGRYEGKTSKAEQRLLPPPRTIKSRDDLSFTRRDESGRLINWVLPLSSDSWHVHYGMGETWFSEIVALARHKPQDAYKAMLFAGPEMIRFWQYGHAQGFFDQMASWAMTGILNAAEPKLPFEVFGLGIAPRPGVEYHMTTHGKSGAVSDVDEQAWQESLFCQRQCYQRRLRSLQESFF